MSDEIKRTVHGIGYIGIGKHMSRVGGDVVRSYAIWQSMMERCYCQKTLKKRPSYIGCSVVSEWHNYQNFADWFEIHDISGFVMDKDILVKGNKIYSPLTCVFVPKEINSMFVSNKSSKSGLPKGVISRSARFESRLSIKGILKHLGTFDTLELAFQAYKRHKEDHIKNVAKIWKPKIAQNVYEALMNYTIEIND